MSAVSNSTSRRLVALSAILLGSFALPAHGQETVIDAGEVVVNTPNRSSDKKDRVGSKVEVVTKADIEEKSLPTALDYLTILPGVSVSSPGGTGQEASIAIRGAAKRYIKTLYNGIDISDPTSTQVQTSYQYLLSGQLSSIEVLKGSQSTLYGSDAIAGVIALNSFGAIEPGVHHEVALEAGSFGTVRSRYAFTAANEATRFAANIAGLYSRGISAADAANGNTEKDPYQNVTADVNFEHRFSDAFSVFASGLMIKAKADYDEQFGIGLPIDNPDNVNLTSQLAGRAGFNLNLLDGRFRNTVSVQVFDIERGLRSTSIFGPYNADYHGRRIKADYQGAFDATDWLTLQFGADHERQQADVTDNYGTNTKDKESLTGVWTQAVVSPNEDLTFTGGLRHDEHSVFGGHTTWRATGSWRVNGSGTRLHASAGTGFRAPSLYELFAPFGTGNPALQPETSTSYDAGVEQTWLGGALVTDVTGFILNTDNLITYNDATFTYQQLPGTTKRHGVEVSAQWRATDTLALGGAYTWTHSVLASGARNARVPAHEVALTAVWTPVDKWTLSGAARIVLDTIDNDGLALKDYVLVNARLAYKPTEMTEIYLRGENLLNQKYQTVRGYGTPGAAVYAGFKARF